MERMGPMGLMDKGERDAQAVGRCTTDTEDTMAQKLGPHRQRRLNHVIEKLYPGKTWFDVAQERQAKGDTVSQLAGYFEREFGIGVSASTLYNWLLAERKMRQAA